MFSITRTDCTKWPKLTSSTVMRLSLLAILTPTVVSGNEISTPDKTGNIGRFSSLVLDIRGFPIISYYDITQRDLKLVRCGNPNCNDDRKNRIHLLDTEGTVGMYTSTTLDKRGNPVVSYLDASNGKLKLLRCDNPNCAHPKISIPDTSERVGRYSSLVLDKASNPVVSYYDEEKGDLKLLHCDDPSCIGDESKNISTPDSSGDVGLYTSLVLDRSGNPVISYYASSSGLRILHCDDPRCADDESANVAVPDKGEVGWYSDLTIDAAGNPVIGYFDFSKGDLKLLHCDDPNCSGDESKNITSPDTAGQVGGELSMVLDANGNPVISYNDATNGDLKVLHCDNPNCAGDQSNNITTVDENGEVGSFTSLALDTNGSPVVSYYDFSNGLLKLLHCTNPDCKE